ERLEGGVGAVAQAADHAGKREPPQPRRSEGAQVPHGADRAAFLRHGRGHRVRLRPAAEIANPTVGLYDPARHTPLTEAPWDPAAAQAAIDEILADTRAAYDAERYWPAHPLDEGLSDSSTTLYFG